MNERQGVYASYVKLIAAYSVFSVYAAIRVLLEISIYLIPASRYRIAMRTGVVNFFNHLHIFVLKHSIGLWVSCYVLALASFLGFCFCLGLGNLTPESFDVMDGIAASVFLTKEWLDIIIEFYSKIFERFGTVVCVIAGVKIPWFWFLPGVLAVMFNLGWTKRITVPDRDND